MEARTTPHPYLVIYSCLYSIDGSYSVSTIAPHLRKRIEEHDTPTYRTEADIVSCRHNSYPTSRAQAGTSSVAQSFPFSDPKNVIASPTGPQHHFSLGEGAHAPTR